MIFMFSPLKSSIKHRQIASFDVEGHGGEGGFLCGAVIKDDTPYFFTDREKMCEFLLSHSLRNYLIYATNLQYDLPILFQPFHKGWFLVYSGSRLIYAKHKDEYEHVHVFCDTANYTLNWSVEKMGKNIGLEKLTTPELLKNASEILLDFSKLPEKTQLEIRRYNIRDALITYKFMQEYQKTVIELGGELKKTAGATSMDLFRRKYLERSYITPFEKLNNFARLGYYGGRTEVFIKGYSENLYHYDYISMYPSVMRDAQLPNPNFLRFHTCSPKWSEVREYEGLTECIVSVPNSYFPLLPARKINKLYFPSGILKGTWTNVELREAEERGAKIKRVYRALYSTETCNIFRGFVDSLFSLREKYLSENDSRAEIVKLLLNSLYGKFGQHSGERAGILVDILSVKNVDMLVGKTPYLTDFGEYVMLSFGRKKQPSYINVLWSAYITALARLKLFREIEKYEHDIVYVDTDSIITARKLQTSDCLGGLSFKAKISEGIFLYPKFYYTNAEDNHETYRIRGIPSRYRAEFFTRGEVKFTRPTKIKESLRHNWRMAEWMETQRTMRIQEDKRQIVNSQINFFRENSDTEPFKFQLP